MAFSLGIISYTISRLVETIEEFVDDNLEDESAPDPAFKEASETAAEEVFAVISEISKDASEKKEEPATNPPAAETQLEAYESARPATPSSVTEKDVARYVDVEVTEHFLTYNYDFDDIANTRLRFNASSHSARLFGRRFRNQQREQDKTINRKRELRRAEFRESEQRRNQKAQETKKAAREVFDNTMRPQSL